MHDPRPTPTPSLPPASPALSVVHAGTNRAARAMAKTYPAVQAAEGIPIGVLGVDARGTRGATWAHGLLPGGVAGRGITTRIEDYLRATDGPHALVCTVDRIPSIQAALATVLTQGAKRPVATYFIARAADGKVWGIASAIRSGDEDGLITFSRFLDRFVKAVVPSEYDDVFGGVYAPDAFSVEPRLRDAFNTHFADFLTAAASRQPLARPPLEMAWQGTLLPLSFQDRTLAWADPQALGEKVTREGAGVLRGRDFAIAEAGPNDAMRFHIAHLRSDRPETELLTTVDLPAARPVVAPLAFASRQAPMAVTD